MNDNMYRKAGGGFNRLLSGSFLASMGDKFFSISLSWWILNESGIADTGFVLGMVMAVTGMCTMLFVPLLGSLADIFDRRRCMLISMATSIASLAALLATYNLLRSAPGIIYSVSVILGILTAFFMSSVQSSVTFLVPKERVPKAVAMVVMATPASQVIGSSIAGFAIAAFGIRGSVSCDLLLYVAGAILLLTVPSFGIKADDDSAPKPKYTDVLLGGIRYLKREKALFHMLLYFAAINLFFAPILIMMPMIATTYYAGNSVALAMMEGSYSGGLILMSVLLNRNKRAFNRHQAIFRAILMMSVCMMTIGFVHISWLVYVMLVVCGAMLSLTNVSLGSIYQMYVPQEYKGRFFALLQVTARAASPIGFAMVGWLSDIFGVCQIILINGIVVFALSTLWLVLKKLDFDYTF